MIRIENLSKEYDLAGGSDQQGSWWLPTV